MHIFDIFSLRMFSWSSTFYVFVESENIHSNEIYTDRHTQKCTYLMHTDTHTHTYGIATNQFTRLHYTLDTVCSTVIFIEFFWMMKWNSSIFFVFYFGIVRYWIDSVPPMLSIPNQLEAAYQGQDVTLECQTEAYPASINYWTTEKGDMIISGE